MARERRIGIPTTTLGSRYGNYGPALGFEAPLMVSRHRLATFMGSIFGGYPAWEWAIAFAFLGAGAVQAIYYVARSGSRRRRDQAITAICMQRGMLRVEDVRLPFLPQMLPLAGPVLHNTYATPDMSLWFSDVGDRSGPSTFAVLMFGIQELNLPYIGVARKGQVDVPLGARGQTVQLESIDFTDRFQIHADDPRAAVMLIDQGMMQWLLDCDRVSFQVSGPLVSAMVKRRDQNSAQPIELELLLQFHDGFAAHVPQLVHTEFPAPAGFAEAAVHAIQSFPNLIR